MLNLLPYKNSESMSWVCGKILSKSVAVLLEHLFQWNVNTGMTMKSIKHPSCNTQLHAFWCFLYSTITTSQIVPYYLPVHWSWPKCSHSILISQATDLCSVNYFVVLAFWKDCGSAPILLIYLSITGAGRILLDSSLKKVEQFPRKAYSNHSLYSDNEFGLILREIVLLLYLFRMNFRFIHVSMWHGSLCLELSEVGWIIQALLRKIQSSTKP